MEIRTLRAYRDLLRLHFAWPLLFCFGTVLAFAAYEGFLWADLITAALIRLFGFEAGMVLNDYVDRVYDKRDVEGRMTGYWRPFGTRPIAEGLIPARHALIIFVVLVLCTLALILTLPYPHSLYVTLMMGYTAISSRYSTRYRSGHSHSLSPSWWAEPTSLSSRLRATSPPGCRIQQHCFIFSSFLSVCSSPPRSK